MASVSDCATGINASAAINDGCTCEGYDQIYECRITGSGATIWRGSAFNCSAAGNELPLPFLHSSSGTDITCNDGAISGRIIRAENNTYISQLMITVTVGAEIIGTMINSYHDSRGTQNLIGSSLIALTRGTTSFH